MSTHPPDRLVKIDQAEQPARQVAALVWRPAPVEPDVLLVTSRTTRHWLLPKGWLVNRLSDAQSAAEAAFDEAGATTDDGEGLLGTYQYDRTLPDGSIVACPVDVFGFRLIRLADQWPAMTERRRRWYGAQAAASLLADPDLAALVRSFGTQVRSEEASG